MPTSDLTQINDAIRVFGLPAALLFAHYKGWWVWGRDYRKLEKERDEWKTLALRHLGIAEKATLNATPTT